MRILILLFLICGTTCLGIDKTAIAELKAGKRSEANVSWWADDKNDNTSAIQNTLDSGAKRVIIPYKATPWISGPLFLRSNQEIILEKGAVLQAKDDDFRTLNTKFINIKHCENVTITGYSATIKMNRAYYIKPPFYRCESRHIIDIKGSKNIKITGLSLTDGGGDGICISNGSGKYYAENILLKDLNCRRNFRRGLSVSSVRNLTVENCIFAETGGALPGTGVDLSPQTDNDSLENILFQRCLMKNNNGTGFSISAYNLTENAAPFSITLQNCVIDGSWEAGIGIAGISWDGPDGLLDIVQCEIKNTLGPGIYIKEKSSTRLKTRFLNCKLSNTAIGLKQEWPDKPWIPKQSYWLTKDKLNAPIVIASTHPHLGKHVGYLEFVNCTVRQNRSNSTIILFDTKHKNYAERIKGTIRLLDHKRPYLKGQSICYDVYFKFVDADNKQIGWFLGKRWPKYTPIEANARVLSRKVGEYYTVQKGGITYNAVLTPDVKARNYRVGFRYKTPSYFRGHMLVKTPQTSLMLKATNDKWRMVALHGVELDKSGKIPVNISVLDAFNTNNKIGVEKWQLAAEEVITDK